MSTILEPSSASPTPVPPKATRGGGEEHELSSTASLPSLKVWGRGATYQVDDLPPRIAEKIKVDQTTGCWNWTGSINLPGGYGRVWWEGRVAFVHRLTHHLLRDSNVPVWPGRTKRGGLVLDHLCHNRVCANPTHLALCSIRTNCANRLVGTSRLVGVSWKANVGRWRVSVDSDAGERYSSLHDDELEAGLAALALYEQVNVETAALARTTLVQYVAEIQAWLKVAA